LVLELKQLLCGIHHRPGRLISIDEQISIEIAQIVSHP